MGKRIYLFCVLSLLMLGLSACAHLYKTQIHDVVYISDEQFSVSEDGDLSMAGLSGKVYVLDRQHFINLRSVRNKMMPVTGGPMQIALVDSDLHTVLLLSYKGKNYVAMSFNFLNLFGEDEESLAAAMSHQHAHIVVGDSADIQDNRELNYFLTKEIVSTGVSIFATAAGGYGAGAVIDEAKHIQDAKIEDQTNPIAIDWIIKAGYTPCGYIKMKYVMEKNSAVSSALTYLFTHPGVDERVKISKDYLTKNNLDCKDFDSIPTNGIIIKSGKVQK